MMTEAKSQATKEVVPAKFPGLLGKKIGMTQIFGQDGSVTPVTVLEAGPCAVLQVKSVQSDKYNAIQLGFGNGKKKRATLPMLGHFKKAHLDIPKRFIREFRFPNGPEGEKQVVGFKLGDHIKVDIFEGVWKVNISGITKGRGFAGVIKRWNQHRGPESHGSTNVRAPGSIGSDTRLTHIRPGKHMPGHYGVEKVTVKNLEVMRVDKKRGLLLVKGAVPGYNKGFVVIQWTNLVKPAPKVSAKTTKKIDTHGTRKK